MIKGSKTIESDLFFSMLSYHLQAIYNQILILYIVKGKYNVTIPLYLIKKILAFLVCH